MSLRYYTADVTPSGDRISMKTAVLACSVQEAESLLRIQYRPIRDITTPIDSGIAFDDLKKLFERVDVLET